MQMVANGYCITLVPELAVDVEMLDPPIRLLRFAPPEPARTFGLAWRRTSPRKQDFAALGKMVTATLGAPAANLPRRPQAAVRFRFRAQAGPGLPGSNSRNGG